MSTDTSTQAGRPPLAPESPAATGPTTPAGLPGAFRVAAPEDPSVLVLLEDLVREYDERYGRSSLGQHGARAEIDRYPAAAFTPPDGAFLVYEEAGEVLSGAAFKRLSTDTAEVKRVWTRADQRGRGLARITMAELERVAAAAGYGSLFLTTGPHQPEAVRLYLGAGWAPGFDPARYPVHAGPHPFTTTLGPAADGHGASAAVRETFRGVDLPHQPTPLPHPQPTPLRHPLPTHLPHQETS